MNEPLSARKAERHGAEQALSAFKGLPAILIFNKTMPMLQAGGTPIWCVGPVVLYWGIASDGIA
jgi:hypothetical protein